VAQVVAMHVQCSEVFVYYFYKLNLFINNKYIFAKMEKRHGNENKLHVFVAEFIGTAILSLTFCIGWQYFLVIEQSAGGLFISGAASWYLFLALGCCLYSVYFILSPISGGHFNPALSIAVYISLAFNINNIVILMMILVAQFLGAFLGMLLSRGLRTFVDQTIVTYPTYPFAPTFNS
jgi:hypothetical protein